MNNAANKFIVTLSNGTDVARSHSRRVYTHAVVSVVTEATVAANRRSLDEWLAYDRSWMSSQQIERFNKHTAFKRAYLQRLVVGEDFEVITWATSEEMAEKACHRARTVNKRPGRSIKWDYRVIPVNG